MFSVLIVDDHFVARHGLKQILREEFRDLTFGEAATAADALREIARQPWTVVVLDISLPGSSGIHLLQEIRRERPDARVLVLGVHSEPRYVERALALGAFAYVTKDAGRAELLAAFRSLLAGKKYIGSSLPSMPDAPSDVAPDVLSARERTVLLALAAGKRIHEIARELNLDDKTVSSYRRRILTKLHLHTVADMVRYVIDRSLK